MNFCLSVLIKVILGICLATLPVPYLDIFYFFIFKSLTITITLLSNQHHLRLLPVEVLFLGLVGWLDITQYRQAQVRLKFKCVYLLTEQEELKKFLQARGCLKFTFSFAISINAPRTYELFALFPLIIIIIYDTMIIIRIFAFWVI